MGETGRKKQRKREPIKKTELLPPIPTDPSVSDAQFRYCKQLVAEVLDDEQALSFSKPVGELWDPAVLTDYFENIKHPMDLGTVQRMLLDNRFAHPASSRFDPNPFRHQVRLVFLNALHYNQRNTDLHRLASKFIHFIDSRLAAIPVPSAAPSPDRNRSASPPPAAPAAPAPAPAPAPASDPASAPASDPASAPKPHNRPTTPPADPSHHHHPDHHNRHRQMSPPPTEHVAAASAADKLRTHIAAAEKRKAKSEAALAELDAKRSLPLSFEENSRLRDEVEKLPWDTAQKVVNILRKYVDDALEQMSEEDPEFVTLEFSTVEPRLLRDIESLVRPDPARDRERKAIEQCEEEIANAKRKLRILADGDSGKKKARRRR